MGKREIKVSIQAQVAEYEAAMMRAAKRTREMGSEADKAAQKARAFEQVGRSWAIAGGVMAAGIGVAVKRFADFDQAMSNVAATGQDARENLKALRDAAIDAGASTVYSATEAANAVEELAKAGVSARDILGGGLKGALDLAAAGGLGVADAAGIAATALKTFNLQGSDMSHVADLLAAGAGKAMGDVQDLSQALAQGGLVAKSTGLSIEETTAALASFASQGLLGSDAGTSLKSMLQRLNPESKKAADQFDALGISAYDANGQFVGLADFAGQLRTSMQDLTPEARNAAMSVIFGSDAVRAANVLYAEGEEGIRDWIKAVDDQGYASDTARERLDNLKGDIEALGGAFDSALIQMGEAADGPLRAIVQGMTGVVDIFNELPDGAKDAVFWLGATGSAALTAGGLYLSAVPKIAEYKANIKALGGTVSTTTRLVALSSAGLAGFLAAATVAVGALATAQAEATARAEAYAETIEEGSQRITEATREMAQENLAARDAMLWWENMSAYDAAEKLGISLDLVTDAALRDTKAMEQLQLQVEAAGQKHRSSKDDYEAYEGWVRTLTEAVSGEAGSLEKAIEISRQKDEANKDAADSTEVLAEATKQATADLDEMKDALQGVADTALGVGDAKDAAQSAINAMAEAADGAKVSLKGTNDESIAFRKSLRDVEERSRASAQAILDNGGSAKEARAEWQKGRDAIVDQLEAMGLSEKAAKKWADENLGSAGDVKGALDDVYDAANRSTELDIQTANAEAALARIKAALNYIDTTPATVVVNMGQAGTRERRAGGGAIYGPGTDTSDNIPALLSPGEHVIPAKEVRRAGGQASIYRARADLMAGGPLRFASGGAVTRDEYIEWIRYRRRGEARQAGMNGSGMQLVDRLFDIADARGGEAGKRRRAQALEQERAYQRLEKAAKGAADAVAESTDAVDEARSAWKSVKGAVASAVRGLFDLAKIGAVKTEDVEKTRKVERSLQVGGTSVSFFDTEKYTETVTTKPTFKSIFGATKSAGARMKRFADKLKTLASRKVSAAFLEELALLGVEEGEPIADAFLTATASEIADFNQSYKAMDKYSNQAGTTVADANYAKLIETTERQLAADQKHADAINKQLKVQTDRIIERITAALKGGLKRAAGGPVYGPGTTTSDSINTWLSNDEHVWSAAEVKSWGGHENVAHLRAGRLVPTLPMFRTGAAGASSSAAAPPVHQEFHGDFYAYDPHQVGREAAEKLSRVLDARGI